MSRPSNQQAKAFHNKLDGYGDVLKTPGQGGPSYANYQAEMTGDYRAQHPRYPDFQYPDDKEADTYFKGRETMRTKLGADYQIQLGRADVEYLLRKKDAQEMVRFKQFVEDSIPRGTPWAKDFFEKIMPGWYQSKIDIINEKMGIVQRFVDITVRGPQTIDDMFLLYQIYQGRVTLPTNFADLIRPDTQGVDHPQFSSGLFNPKRYLTSTSMASRRNQDFMANFAIPGIDIKGAAHGQQTGAAWAQNNNTGTDYGDEDSLTNITAINTATAAGAQGTGYIGPRVALNDYLPEIARSRGVRSESLQTPY